MNTQAQRVAIEEIAASIEIPDSSYEAAKRRYDDLGEWLVKNPKSKSAQFKPHVFPQGSFRYGTAIRPFGNVDYDLDLCCNLQSGVTKGNCTQEQLKELLGQDLETYRIERSIKERLERKHRCWRLNYQDVLKFHVDTVPCIPELDEWRRVLQQRMIQAGTVEILAERISKLAVSVTDDRTVSYRTLSNDWNVSNPEGYALWFENRMKQAKRLLEKRAVFAEVGRVDDMPAYRWRTPLQACVQILKKHRNVMFMSNPDAKPISVIITTLAGLAYQGEEDVQTAMQTVLSKIDVLINPMRPRVPNPVNPQEDFADKWPTETGQKLQLEENFWKWVSCAKRDFRALGASDSIEYLDDQVSKRFGAKLNSQVLQKRLAAATASAVGTGIANQTPKKPVDYRGGGRYG
jgi:hypothetical protein